MPAVGGQAGDVAPEHLDPAVGGHEPADRVHERALPRAVRADEARRARAHRPAGRPGRPRTRPPKRTVIPVATNQSPGGVGVGDAPTRDVASPVPPMRRTNDASSGLGTADEALLGGAEEAGEAAGGEQQDGEDAHAGHEERHDRLVGPDGGHADDPERAQHRAHQRAPAPRSPRWRPPAPTPPART